MTYDFDRIGAAELARARETLEEYRRGKANLENRIIDNEQWYKLRHFEQLRGRGGAATGDPEPASAWLLNCIANKHADAMDSYPAPCVLPREPGDEETAEALSQILPVILDRCGFERVYSDVWWYKLKAGTGVFGVFWNNAKNRGMGDVDIKQLDLLNLFWEPGIKDIQKSRNLFHVELYDNDVLLSRWPELEGRLGTPAIDVARYIYDDAVDTSKKSVVVDWYYKRSTGGREVLHYCKFCNGVVLYASENDPATARRGFYDHGLYPVVFDPLFVEEGTPSGFGYVDVCKQAQLYIDKLNSVILKNAIMAARPRWFIRGEGSVNEAEYADWSKDFVHYMGSGDPRDSVMQIDVKPLPEICAVILNNKIEELKETSGNRDFSQGGTSSGVTAASAIAALQEAGSKLSRDMIKSCYRAFSEVNYLVIELIRQFYDEPRCFRITGGDAGAHFTSFSNASIRPGGAAPAQGLSPALRGAPDAPEFDIRVVSQKSSPFSAVAQNERAKELYRLGFFKPEMANEALCALELMDFEGKDAIKRRLQENAMRLEEKRQLAQRLAALASGGADAGALNGREAAPGASPADGEGGGKAQQTAGEARKQAVREASGR